VIDAPRKRSAAAKALATPLYKQRIVKPRKGRGSYRRFNTFNLKGRRT
jgi:stalled ribosome alternative rescue factor ArfA